jgi:hypothetical protein
MTDRSLLTRFRDPQAYVQEEGTADRPTYCGRCGSDLRPDGCSVCAQDNNLREQARNLGLTDVDVFGGIYLWNDLEFTSIDRLAEAQREIKYGPDDYDPWYYWDDDSCPGYGHDLEDCLLQRQVELLGIPGVDVVNGCLHWGDEAYTTIEALVDAQIDYARQYHGFPTVFDWDYTGDDLDLDLEPIDESDDDALALVEQYTPAPKPVILPDKCQIRSLRRKHRRRCIKRRLAIWASYGREIPKEEEHEYRELPVQFQPSKDRIKRRKHKRPDCKITGPKRHVRYTRQGRCGWGTDGVSISELQALLEELDRVPLRLMMAKFVDDDTRVRG